MKLKTFAKGSSILTALSLVVSLLSGCAAETMPDHEEPISSGEEALYANTYSIWRTLSIPVCWENPLPKHATQRAWVKEAITESWQENSKLKFTGWGACTNAKTGGLRIAVDNESPASTDGVGQFLKDVSAGISLNFEFKAPSDYAYCAKEFGAEQCVRHTAIHEFGHALGFAHEQNRPDAVLLPGCAEQGSDGNVRVGAYDLHSIMNYCNEDVATESLSSGDVLGLQAFYGNPDAALYRKDAIRVNSKTGYFLFGSRYTRYDFAKGAMADLGTSTTYPRSIAGAWRGWPTSFASGVDAILEKDGLLYMLNDRNYLVYDLAQDKVTRAPRSLTGRFTGLPATWSKVDAAVKWSPTRYYLFRGKEYVRYDVTNGCKGGLDVCGRVPSGYPRPISGNWPGLKWSNIDQIVECSAEELCIFKGSEFVKYRKSSPEGVVSGYPAPIVGRFPGVTF